LYVKEVPIDVLTSSIFLKPSLTKLDVVTIATNTDYLHILLPEVVTNTELQNGTLFL
jgi:hypothetical protein